jgi:hypothetical protein
MSVKQTFDYGMHRRFTYSDTSTQPAKLDSHM